MNKITKSPLKMFNEKHETLIKLIEKCELSEITKVPDIDKHINFNKCNLLITSVKFKKLDVLKYLVKKGGKISTIKDKALIIACKNNDLSMVKYLIKNRALVKFNNYESMKVACEFGNLEIIKYFVLNGTQLKNIKSKFMFDAYNSEMIKYLMDNGITFENVQNIFRNVCDTNDINMLNYMLSRNIFPKYNDFVHACEKTNLNLDFTIALFDVLQRNNLFCNYNNDIKYALLIAAKSNNTEVCKFLVSKGAEINDFQGMPNSIDAIFNVCENGNVQLYDYFTQHALYLHYDTYFYVSTFNNHLELTKKILESKKINASIFYVNFLNDVCETRNRELVKCLIDYGFSTKHIGCNHETYDIISFLIDNNYVTDNFLNPDYVKHLYENKKYATMYNLLKNVDDAKYYYHKKISMRIYNSLIINQISKVTQYQDVNIIFEQKLKITPHGKTIIQIL